MADSNKLLIYGGLAVGAFLLLKGNGATGVTSLVSTLLPGQPAETAPNLAQPVIPGAPILQPPVFNANYYLQYQYPALLQINPNLANSNYQLNAQDVQNYYNNYLELQQWYANEAQKQFGSMQKAMQYHWSHFGVPYEYSFVPFTPPKNAQWIPPPPNPKSSGGGLLRTIVQAATTIGGGVLTVATGGALAPIIVPATAALVNVEGAAIHGNDSETVVLNDMEINVINTSAAIIKKILPFYLNSRKTLVDSINLKLDNIIATYAP